MSTFDIITHLSVVLQRHTAAGKSVPEAMDAVDAAVDGTGAPEDLVPQSADMGATERFRAAAEAAERELLANPGPDYPSDATLARVAQIIPQDRFVPFDPHDDDLQDVEQP